MTQPAFLQDSEIQKQIDGLVSKVQAAQSQIQGVTGPVGDKESSLKEALDEMTDLRGRGFFHPYVGSGLGNGPYVQLTDGSVKLDLINGIGIHLLGHGHPDVIRASIQAGLQDVVMQGNLQPNQEYQQLLKTLVTAAGKNSRLKHGWIGTCGTIVNENALKMARQKNSPARKILALRDNFCGRSTMMAEITDNPGFRVGLPAYNEVLYIPFYDPADPQSTEKAVKVLEGHIQENPKDIAFFIFELVQGEGGFRSAPPEYFKALFDICKKHHIALWADEVQTFARTGELFAFETLGLGDYMDLVTIAKTPQIGCVFYTEEYNPKPGLIAGTFTGSTQSLAAGQAIMNVMLSDSPKMLGANGKVAEINKKFVGMLQSLMEGSCKGLLSGAGGFGLMVHMTPFDGSKEKTTAFVQKLFQNGIIAFYCGHGPVKVRFLLPAVLEDKHISEASQIIEKTLKECAG